MTHTLLLLYLDIHIFWFGYAIGKEWKNYVSKEDMLATILYALAEPELSIIFSIYELPKQVNTLFLWLSTKSSVFSYIHWHTQGYEWQKQILKWSDDKLCAHYKKWYGNNVNWAKWKTGREVKKLMEIELEKRNLFNKK
jgi:hypothetical protein